MQLVITHNVKTSVTIYIHATAYIHVKTYIHASADDMVGIFSIATD